jgi:dinuclear metal center YbgI/SA1388 family protein
MKRDELVKFLDDLLNTAEVSDDSFNGLQFPGTGDVTRVALAVDACLQTTLGAIEHGAEMLLVHHGLFWKGQDYGPIGEARKAQLKSLIESDLNLYASHLPLDLHPEVGNNAELCRLVGLNDRTPWLEYNGTRLGFYGRFEEDVTIDALADRLEMALGERPRVLPFGPSSVGRVGICSGGAQSGMREAVELGLNTFVLGEMAHYMYHYARERELNVLLGGHYLTETVGVKAVGRLLEEKFGLETVFIDVPTGL